jgi:hypothetical protein
MTFSTTLKWVAPLVSILALPSVALADDTIKHPGDHPHYAFEIEPHLLLGWGSDYGTTGVGIGGRVSIPIVQDGFVKTINNSVAIGFGLDFVHYSGCYGAFGNFAGDCGANYIFIPVVMQWNFFVAEHWSVFGEPGLYIYHGFFDTNYCGTLPGGVNVNCTEPSTTGVGPAFYIGGRYHFSEHVALTMRIGYPSLSVGVSFM